MWVPRASVARRCGAKLLTAHRGGGIELSMEHEIACVDAISRSFMNRPLCRLVGVLWIRHGHTVLAWEEAKDEPPLRRKPELDEQLEQALAVG